MHVTSSSLRQSSGHEAVSLYSKRETIKISGNRALFDRLNSQGARRVSTAEKRFTEELEDFKFKLLKRMLEAITGKRIDSVRSLRLEPPPETPVLTAPQPQTAQPQAPVNVEYTMREQRYEAEKTTFSAEGIVKTADGREIAVTVDLSMSREYYSETNVRLVNGRQVTDPLVVNFGGTAAQLTSDRFSFDLDSDGKAEEMATLAPSSGYLALDRNSNGTVDDGSELFGPATGRGFSELARYDEDKNGWIDEGDSVYGRLKVWVRDGSGKNGTLIALAQLGVGAISLQNLKTPFDIKDTATNETMGTVRSTAVFLGESGGAGTVQQLDLAV